MFQIQSCLLYTSTYAGAFKIAKGVFEAVAGYFYVRTPPGNPERVIQRISGMCNVAARPDGKREHVTLGLGKEKRMELKIAGVVKESIVDGRGIRYTVFTQGCPHHCPGCHNPQTHDFYGGKTVEVGELLSLIHISPHSGYRFPRCIRFRY